MLEWEEDSRFHIEHEVLQAELEQSAPAGQPYIWEHAQKEAADDAAERALESALAELSLEEDEATAFSQAEPSVAEKAEKTAEPPRTETAAELAATPPRADISSTTGPKDATALLWVDAEEEPKSAKTSARESANTLLNAPRRSAPPQYRRLALYALALLAVFGALGGGYYALENMLAELEQGGISATIPPEVLAGAGQGRPLLAQQKQEQPAPAVAEEIQPATAAEAPPEPAAPAAPLIEIAAALAPSKTESEAPPLTTPAAAPQSTTLALLQSASEAAPPRETRPQAKPQPAAALLAAPPAPSQPARPAIRAQNFTPQEELPQREDFTIQRARQAPLKEDLQQAYQAFQDNRSQRAETLYRKILQTAPHNRDALRGIAALALRKGNYQEAAQIYRQILELYPQDRLAQASLINLLGQQANPDAESQLKSFIAQNPQAAPLHFSLGNWYSRQQRWREAQQAYFEAHRYAPEHPDYAYNLAISLDQLDKPRLAKQYYQQALRLAAAHPAEFNQQAAQQRLATLQAALSAPETP